MESHDKDVIQEVYDAVKKSVATDAHTCEDALTELVEAGLLVAASIPLLLDVVFLNRIAELMRTFSTPQEALAALRENGLA